MSKQLVAVQIEKDGQYEMVEFVSRTGGWTTIVHDGKEKKVRNSQVAAEEGDAEDMEIEGTDPGVVTSRDVIPNDIRDNYSKGKLENGQHFIDSGDELAVSLRGQPVEESAKALAKLDTSRTAEGWLAFYTTDREIEGKKPLNVGMVRMNLGNRIRAAIKALEEVEA